MRVLAGGDVARDLQPDRATGGVALHAGLHDGGGRGIVVTAAQSMKDNVLRRQKCDRWDQLQFRVSERTLGRRRQGSLEPRRVEAEEFALKKHNVDDHFAEHPATARGALAHVMVKTKMAKLGFQVRVALRGHGFEDDVEIVGCHRHAIPFSGSPHMLHE